MKTKNPYPHLPPRARFGRATHILTDKIGPTYRYSQDTMNIHTMERLLPIYTYIPRPTKNWHLATPGDWITTPTGKITMIQDTKDNQIKTQNKWYDINYLITRHYTLHLYKANRFM